MIALIIIKMVDSRISNVGLHRGWLQTSLSIYELLIDGRRGSMQPRGISHMHKTPKILQADLDDTAISKMGVRRKLPNPLLNP